MIGLAVILAAVVSVAYDLYTQPSRMTKWEAAHPGRTYIRGYKKEMRGAGEHTDA